MKHKPGLHEPQLLDGQRPCEELAINRNGRRILAVIDMDVELVMLLRI